MIRYACFLFILSTISAKSIIVPTPLGKIRGKFIHDEITGTSFYSFTGIPYAVPPLGDLRFEPPVPIQPSCSVIDATKPAPVCPQREFFHTRDQMSEDCLFLNVYVPAKRTNNLMPVNFHIHGGSFDSQSGNAHPTYGPALFVQNNILVTLNYRLGVLGFLSLCNEEVSGNAGVKDVVLALKTVHKIIVQFGGDPNKITLLGNGAGSAMVQLLMLTDETKGLFSGVMLQSATVLSTKYMQLYPRQNALSLTREMGITYRNDADMIKQLKCTDAFDMVNATTALNNKDPQRGYRLSNAFTPTVEKETNCAILTEPPLDLMKRGAIQDVPVVYGINNQEGLLVYSLLKKEPQLIEKFNEDPELLIPEDIQYPKGSEARRNLAARIIESYSDDTNKLAIDQDYIDLMSDSQFLYPSDEFVRLFCETKKSPVYYNLCAVDTELNYLKAVENINYPGCAHVDEIGYEFITDVTRPKYQNLSSTPTRIQTLVLGAANNFATSRVPTDIPGLWPPAGPERYHIVIYNDATVTVYQAPYPERMAFWGSVYKEYFNSEYNIGSYFCLNENACSAL